jgi:hypothetical protein
MQFYCNLLANKNEHHGSPPLLTLSSQADNSASASQQHTPPSVNMRYALTNGIEPVDGIFEDLPDDEELQELVEEITPWRFTSLTFLGQHCFVTTIALS